MRRLNMKGAWLLLAGVSLAPATAGEREHSGLPRGVAPGVLVPLFDILERLQPFMRNYQYIGAEFYEVARIYRLKFLSEGRVVWIDVDGRTGRVIRRISP